jgi:hypothetical protein
VVKVSWPKKLSKVLTDIIEDTIREIVLPLEFVEIKNLLDEERRVDGRKRRSVYVWRVKPASHASSIRGEVSGVKFAI